MADHQCQGYDSKKNVERSKLEATASHNGQRFRVEGYKSSQRRGLNWEKKNHLATPRKRFDVKGDNARKGQKLKKPSGLPGCRATTEASDGSTLRLWRERSDRRYFGPGKEQRSSTLTLSPLMPISPLKPRKPSSPWQRERGATSMGILATAAGGQS